MEINHLLHALESDLMKLEFQQISKYTIISIVESGLADKSITSNELNISDDEMALSIKGISNQELAVEISYSNQLMTEKKLIYLRNVMNLINNYNERLKRSL